jgi:hypothetical protein
MRPNEAGGGCETDRVMKRDRPGSIGTASAALPSFKNSRRFILCIPLLVSPGMGQDSIRTRGKNQIRLSAVNSRWR